MLEKRRKIWVSEQNSEQCPGRFCAELIANGGFETPLIATNSSYTGNAGATGLGWLVSQSNIQLRNGAFQIPAPRSGKQYVAMNAGSAGQITVSENHGPPGACYGRIRNTDQPSHVVMMEAPF